MLWMIDKHPGDYISFWMGHEYRSRKFAWTETRIEEARARWMRQVRLHPQDAQVLCNAAKFCRSTDDWSMSEKLYKRAKKANPRLAMPARELAYHYRNLACTAQKDEIRKLVRRALREAEDAANRREEQRGNLIGILQEFTPLAIKFGYLKLARKFANRLLYYGRTAFYMWEQYAYLYLAWIDLLEGRYRGLGFKVMRLRKLFEEQPSFIASSNAAVSFVNDAILFNEPRLAQCLLKIFIVGSRNNDDRKKRTELEEWLNAIMEDRKPRLRILRRVMAELY